MFPLSDSSITIDFGAVIDVGINMLVSKLFDYCKNRPFKGFIEAVPAYASLTIFYDVIEVRNACIFANTSYAIVENYLTIALDNLNLSEIKEPELIEIPVLYDGEDLAFVAEYNQLSIKDVIQIHAQSTYRVYMIGFLPGFAYLGGMDERIATPRKSNPRTKVPAGSVGIAGKQTGIYPLESPGGWQLIGKTSLSLFDRESASPSLLKAGDLVRFIKIE
ncbi:5-oxoprolinase subunit PxpB [Emticicia sp. BO119]|uniref:5-oxoprolinase subunit PxpB n=1 Tax=Emticicia sp. BO119 TaxID=2757768 RepID=UPI00286D975A|nr:5-oxoprolinase subunit PxpB [Emticicia sp. BO119]